MSSSTSKGEDPDESVICLDSSVDSIRIENHENEASDNSMSEVITFDKTLPPGVAPDGFIVIDETGEPEKLNTLDNVCDDDEKNEDATKPMFKVFFRDQGVSRLYKKRVRDFLHRLVASESNSDDADLENLVLEVWDKKRSRKRSHEHSKSNETEIVEENSEDEDTDALFKIEKRPTLQDRLDVPAYGKRFERIMDATTGSKKSEDEEETKMTCRPTMSCWNCSGNHSIRDCTQPRNHMEINKNRNEFTARSMQKVGRYHVENNGQKYGHFVPGQITRDLKRALGIRDNQLPQHIYRMRMLGYPPGWLKEARLEHSGMNLYNSDGFLEADANDEDGELLEYKDKDQYDVNKIHDFPGFNVRPPSGTREDNKNYWESDRYAVNSKESLLAMINVKDDNGYKRKKLKRKAEPCTVSPEEISTEMEIVEDTNENVVEDVPEDILFVPPLPKSPSRPPLPSDLEDGAVDSPISTSVDVEAGASPLHADSPSLADLERRKRQLLEELDESSIPSPPATPLTACKSHNTANDAACINQTLETTTPSNEEAQQPTVEAMCQIATPSRGMIKSLDLGTPILASTSPYSKLPSVENFAKDVCDVMHFENLPDSTGKYKQMTGILEKVRNKLATNQQE